VSALAGFAGEGERLVVADFVLWRDIQGCVRTDQAKVMECKDQFESLALGFFDDCSAKDPAESMDVYNRVRRRVLVEQFAKGSGSVRVPNESFEDFGFGGVVGICQI
jgi:hypothetical protein